MMEYLEDTYAWVGTDINGGTSAARGHYNPIFYKKDRFTVKKQGIFWYSDTPESPSKFGDSYSIRMCYWALFEDKVTGKEFYHFNSHFDHIGTDARNKSGLLLPQKVTEIAGDTPAFCTGDFNSNQRTAAYSNIIAAKVVEDAFSKAETRVNADWHTYNDYRYTSTPNANATRIGPAFVTTIGIKVKASEILNTDYSQKYPSDPFPVIIEWCVE